MKTISVLLYEGVDELDLCGPYEVLSSCRRVHEGKWSDRPAFYVETVSQQRTPLKCAHGMTVIADKAVSQALEPAIILVPGGPGARNDTLPPGMVAFLRKNSETAEVVASVCTGVFILAQAGLTDGHRVTTHHAMAGALARQYPGTQVVQGPRVVTSGPNRGLMTSAGISAGVDLALALIARFEGEQAARLSARRIEWPGS